MPAAVGYIECAVFYGRRTDAVFLYVLFLFPPFVKLRRDRIIAEYLKNVYFGKIIRLRLTAELFGNFCALGVYIAFSSKATAKPPVPQAPVPSFQDNRI